MARFGRSFALLLLLGISTTSLAERRTSSVSFVPRRQSQGIDTIHHLKSSTDFDTVSTPSSLKSLARGGALNIPTPSGDEIKGSIAFLLLDHFFRVGFKAKGINFPSQLGGCCILFATMILANVVKPGFGDAVFSFLTPGALWLTKWIAVFFVPGLAMLPLAPSMGNSVEILKVLAVVVVGFYYSAATTAYAVLAIRKMQGTAVTTAIPSGSSIDNGGPRRMPYSDLLANTLAKGLVLSAALSIGATRLGNDFATPLNTVFMLFTAFYGYVWGARLPPAFVKIVHPLVMSTVVTWVATYAASVATGSSFDATLATYKVGSMGLMKAGAGDILLYLLGPSVVSFAISIYSRKQVIADNIITVCTAMIVGSFGGLFGTAAFARLLNIGDGGTAGSVLRKSLLPRNITTPLAIAITNIIGGDIAQACAVVVLTGIYGATFGQSFLNALNISDPVSRGLGMGASAQGLGVATMIKEPEAFPFAASSMVLTAIAATVLVSVPSISDALLKVALGN